MRNRKATLPGQLGNSIQKGQLEISIVVCVLDNQPSCLSPGFPDHLKRRNPVFGNDLSQANLIRNVHLP